MIKEVERFGKKFKIESNLAIKLDMMEKRVKKDWDNVLLVTGMPGIGKSESLSFACAWYLSGPNTHITFDYDQFAQAFDNGKPGDTIICDEFLTVGMGTQAMSKKQNYTKLKMTTGRKKNYNIILVCEDLYELQRYFVKRSVCLIHAFSPNLLDRGDFAYFNYEKKRVMYDIYRGQKKIINFNFKDFFGHYPHYPKNFFYDNASYQKLKDAVIESIGKEDKKITRHEAKYRDIIVKYVKKLKDLKYTHKDIAKLMEVDVNFIDTLSTRHIKSTTNNEQSNIIL